MNNLSTSPATGTNPERVFITGASSGIGMALAQAYLHHGAIVGLVARRSEALQQLTTAFTTQQANFYLCDVRDAQGMQDIAKQFMMQYGVPDIVIANAGVSVGTLTQHEEDISAFKTVVDTNLFGLVHTFQPFIHVMRERGHGQFVGIASVAGVRGLPGAGAYSASKAAATTYLESLRTELQHFNIAVTTIAPGYIRTPMTDVNTHPMPFLMDVDVAAKKIIRAIKQRRRYVIIPWQMGIVARLMRFIPPFLWDALTKKAPQKPGNLL